MRLSLAHSLGGATSGCTAPSVSKLCSGSDAGGGRQWFARSVQDEKAGLADSFYYSTAKVCSDVSEALDADGGMEMSAYVLYVC